MFFTEHLCSNLITIMVGVKWICLVQLEMFLMLEFDVFLTNQFGDVNFNQSTPSVTGKIHAKFSWILLHIFFNWFVYSFIYSFIWLFIYLVIYLYVCLFVRRRVDVFSVCMWITTSIIINVGEDETNSQKHPKPSISLQKQLSNVSHSLYISLLAVNIGSKLYHEEFVWFNS